MKIHLKYDTFKACKLIVEEQLEKLDVEYAMPSFNEVEFKKKLPKQNYNHFVDGIRKYGIEIVESEKSILIEKIKDVIVEMVQMEDDFPAAKTSHYLAEKLHFSYGHLSNIFSEVTYTTIENYIILQKIERVKHLIATENFTFNEIAWKLNYSSLAHLGTQFKNKTGLTLSAFQRIIEKRKEIK